MILDTNALSALADGDLSLEPIVREAESLELPVIVEYRFGIMRSRYRARARYNYFLKDFVASCRVLVVDQHTVEKYGAICVELKPQGPPIPSNDVWIAALARQYDLPILARVEHFDCVRRIQRISW